MKICTKIYLHFQQRRCDPVTLFSGKFEGIPGAGKSNDSGVIENIDFRGLRLQRLKT